MTGLHPEVERFMLAKYPDTDVTPLDLLMIGESLLNTLAAVATLGHANPASTLDYSHPTGVMWADIVRDYTAWTSGRTSLAPECEARLRDLVDTWGWQAHTLNVSAAALGLEATA